MGKNVKRFAFGAVLAAVAGYVAGILTAPKSGKDTRQDIKLATEKGLLEAEKQLKKLHTELGNLLGEAKAKALELKGKAQADLDKAANRAKEVKEKARELLSALHEGDADDQDLGSAVKEAKKAAEHLKSYLKK